MTMRMRYLYRDRGDHIALRTAHEYVVDPRDLDAEGKPPTFFLPIHHAELDEGEVEFDHPATDEELRVVFPRLKSEVLP
ncbi:MAG TPA: hypothetical protein VF753_09880 [Terriglobales bacterium]